MKIEDFLTELQEVLEEEESVQLDTELRSLDSFDSLSTLSIIVFVEENFNQSLTTEDFKEIKTVEDLKNAIGNEHFEN